MSAKVYFTREISPEKVLEMYKLLEKELPGKVACKVHSGEAGNVNFLHPEFWKPIIDSVKGTVVECNTAYEGERSSTAKHKKLISDHKWDSFFDVDIMDAESDVELDVPNGKILKKNLVGKDLLDYDSMLVLSHYKGHPVGGYGGALKQLSIGCASRVGKCRIHTANVTDDPSVMWGNVPENHDLFLEAMADAASSVVKHFEGKMAFINVMCNMSVDCDCMGNAAPPCMKDIGILVSLDPVAIDQACFDLVSNSDDPGKEELLERINSRHGTHTIDAAAELGLGEKEYELIEVK